MSDIYRSAVQVIAWLGLSASQGEHLLPVRDFIQENADLFETDCATRFSEDSVLAGKSAFWAEYWERVWIVQEVASAQEIVFFIGNMDMTFGEVRQLLVFADLATNPRSVRRCEFHVHIMGYVRLCRHAPKVDLWTLLSWVTYRRFKSQKPHDQVYGILGLVANLGDGTSPLEHIEIDYDKPLADVFLDAILESYESWTCYTAYLTAIDLLLGRPDNTKIWEPIFTFLTRYTESNRTSQRHKELAKIFLSVSDALYLIASTPGSPPRNWSTYHAFCKLVPTLVSALCGEHIERTAQSSAAMLGVALTLAKYDHELIRMFEDRKACRRSIVEAGSPWRCAAHRLSVRSRPPLHHIDRQIAVGKELELQLTQYIEWYQARKRKQDAQGGRSVHRSMKLVWTLGLKPPFENFAVALKIHRSRILARVPSCRASFPRRDSVYDSLLMKAQADVGVLNGFTSIF